MQRKKFPLGEGGWGEEGSEEGSEEKSGESILTFSREKSVLTKVVPYDATITIHKGFCQTFQSQ